MSVTSEKDPDFLPKELNYHNGERQLIASFFGKIVRHDQKTAEHCLRVAETSWSVASSNASLPHELIVAGALLHDIGKIAIPPIWLWREQSGIEYTTGHYEEVKKHSVFGYLMLRKVLPQVALIAGGHHYKNNGSGYGVYLGADEEVIKALEIIEIADFIDAMMYRNDLHHILEDRTKPFKIVQALMGRFPSTEESVIIDLTDASLKGMEQAEGPLHIL